MKKQKLLNNDLNYFPCLFQKVWSFALVALLLFFSAPGFAQDVNSCSSIDVSTTTGNGGAPTGIIVSNTIPSNQAVKQAIRIYNENWELVNECSSDKCGTPYLFATEPGKYFLHVLLFEEDKSWLCQSDPIEITVAHDIGPCVSFCQEGLIELKSQADVDAFCGCEVIEGDVRITGDDITSLEPLRALRKVGGFLAILKTKLENLQGLNKLESIGDAFVLMENNQLLNYDGLDRLETIETTFSTSQNSILQSMEGLNALLQVNGTIEITGNDQLLNISALKNIQKLPGLSITGNKSIKTLDGLNGLKSIGEGPTQGGSSISLLIGGNASLENLDALANLEVLTENMTIQFNSSLSDCCGIAHLIDDDPNNGQAKSGIFINDNPGGCNSVEEILGHCQSATPDCATIALSINSNNSQTIDIAGLDAPHYVVKVYDEDWNRILNCIDDCTSVGAYEDGLYRVHVILFDEDWQYLCETDFLKITINSEVIPLDCSDIITNISDLIIENGQARREVTIDFQTPEGQKTDVILNYRALCPDVCGFSLPDDKNFALSEGEYALVILRSYLDRGISNEICSQTYSIDVPSEPCTDNDGDYLCDYNECNDNDPDVIRLKRPVGTACNDDDESTTNDVIQANGCTCAGTSISDNPCDNVTVSLFENDPRTITVDGLTTGHQLVKVYDPHWNVVRDCSGDCDLLGVFNEAGVYRVYAQLYDERWQYLCETDFIEIEIPSTENSSRERKDFINEKEILLFPNPAMYTLNIKTTALKDKKGTVQIFNSFGKLMKQMPAKVFNNDYETIDVGNYENGLYLMTIKMENAKIFSRRFVVEHLK